MLFLICEKKRLMLMMDILRMGQLNYMNNKKKYRQMKSPLFLIHQKDILYQVIKNLLQIILNTIKSITYFLITNYNRAIMQSLIQIGLIELMK